MSRIRHATETFVNHLIDGVKKLISSNTEQINDLFGETIEIGFGKRCKPTTVSSYKDLPNGRWFGTIPDAPVEGVCYYDVYLGDNQVYKRVECKSWLNDTIYFNQNINGAWGEWQQIATTAKTDISSSSLLNGWTMWGNGYGDNLVGCKTGKQVQLNGLLRCGVKTQNTLIVTLPQELRPTCSIIKNVSCYPYGTATIEIQSVGNVLVGNIGEGTLAISMGDVSYFTL